MSCKAVHLRGLDAKDLSYYKWGEDLSSQEIWNNQRVKYPEESTKVSSYRHQMGTIVDTLSSIIDYGVGQTNFRFPITTQFLPIVANSRKFADYYYFRYLGKHADS